MNVKTLHDQFLNPKATFLNLKRQVISWAELRNHELILVHQMGKVGSTAIIKSLEELQLGKPIYHTHCLNPKELADRINQLKLAGKEIPSSSHLNTSKSLSQIIQSDFSVKSWKIISIVREPIARNISAFFQNIELYFPDFANRYQHNELSLNEIFAGFLNSYHHHRPLHWFDLEIKDVFGLDVYKTSFPSLQGYQIINSKNLSLLIIRLEDLRKCCNEAFKTFLNIDNFDLKDENMAFNKSYYHIYKTFKKEIVLPEWYINDMYSSKYVNHFYSVDEINGFRSSWTATPD